MGRPRAESRVVSGIFHAGVLQNPGTAHFSARRRTCRKTVVREHGPVLFASRFFGRAARKIAGFPVGLKKYARIFQEAGFFFDSMKRQLSLAQWLRSRTTVCREGWYYLAIMAMVFAGAMIKEVNLLLILGGMMLGPLLFNWRAVHLTLKGLELKRKSPQAVCAGDPLTVGMRLINGRKYFGSWAVTVEEEIHRQSEAAPNHSLFSYGPKEKALHTAVYFSYVPAGQERTGTYRGRLFERGKYILGPVRISTRFPFGLFGRSISVPERDTIYVYPRLGRLTRNWLARHRQALAGSDRRERRPGPEGDFYGIREWRSGDAMRLVHWRSSARTGKLVVRQFEQPRNRDVAVILDLWQREKAGPTDRENVELAVSFAATVLSDLCRRGGSKVQLATMNHGPHCLGGPAAANLLLDMMKILAVLEGRADDCLPALMDHALRQIASGVEIILVSTRPVDMNDAVRFHAVYSDPHRSKLASRVRAVDTSKENLRELFTIE
jgi:uncharacterized protein (DUF58 family)